MADAAIPGCRFYVQIEGIAQAVFTEVEGLQIETEVMEYPEGGNNEYVHRLPGRSRIGNLVLKRGLAQSNEFYSWYLENIQSNFASRRNLSVLVYDPNGEEVLRWDFLNAFPVKWSGPQLKADDQYTAIESVEIAHEGLGSQGGQ